MGLWDHERKLLDTITDTIVDGQAKHYGKTGELPERIEIDVQIMGPIAPYRLFAEPVRAHKKCPTCGSLTVHPPTPHRYDVWPWLSKVVFVYEVGGVRQGPLLRADSIDWSAGVIRLREQKEGER